MRLRELQPPAYRMRSISDDGITGRQIVNGTTAATLIAALPVQDGVRLDESAVERFGILMLDTKHRVSAFSILSVGCLDATVIHPREVFRAALQGQAAAIVLFHCHPSGDPAPSADDARVTARLKAAGAVVGIDVLDHIIVGHDGRYHSFQEAGGAS